MMIAEFTERTGVVPTDWEYKEIEELYYTFDGGKDEFCKAWVEGKGPEKLYNARARLIERLQDALVEKEKDHRAEMRRLEKKVAQLQEELDKELEWKPATSTGTNMEQEPYEMLKNSGKVESDEDAVKLVNEFFGFEPESVEIIHTVHSYEVDKHHRLRKKAEYERVPCYDSTDWNYIRFNCKGWQYEMINGTLVPYCT